MEKKYLALAAAVGFSIGFNVVLRAEVSAVHKGDPPPRKQRSCRVEKSLLSVPYTL